MKAYTYLNSQKLGRTKENKVEIEFPLHTVEQMYEAQQVINKEFTEQELRELEGLLSEQVLIKTTHEKIFVAITDLYFNQD